MQKSGKRKAFIKSLLGGGDSFPKLLGLAGKKKNHQIVNHGIMDQGCALPIRREPFIPFFNGREYKQKEAYRQAERTTSGQ